jgi:hypothetical protein
METLPTPLRNVLETGECVLFLGAGVGYNVVGRDGKSAPPALQLAKELATKFDINTGPNLNLSKIAAIIEHRYGRKELENFLRYRLTELTPDAAYSWLFTRRWRAIFTTNYDDSIARAYSRLTNAPQNPLFFRETSDFKNYDSRIEVPVFYLHGALHGDSKAEIVITGEDYIKYRTYRKSFFNLLQNEFATSTILYIGYSNTDPNWDLLINEITDEFGNKPLPPSYRIAPTTDELDRELLKLKRNIESIDANLDEFYAIAQAELNHEAIREDKIAQLRKNVPDDLLKAFEQNPPPIIRLMASWEYLNHEKFHVPMNLKAFLNGDLPNWSLIASKHYFERDIETEILSEILEYITSVRKKVELNIILAPAGYGATTLLMTLGFKLISEGVRPVFMLKRGQEALVGDVELVTSLFKSPPIFIIDDAAAKAENLITLIDRLQNLQRPAIFLVASRLNEWRQQTKKPTGHEYQIESLSDPEIYRLLDFLEKHSMLNRLADLALPMRYSVVKNKHQKELLVVMKEATEGKSFDAIIEDEFRQIGNDTAKEIYLITAGFYQYGITPRTALLADILNMSEIEIYDNYQSFIEGVVIYELINESRGIYGVRARHRLIAKIVWDRYGLSGQKEELIQKSLECLNLTYGWDSDAFEKFVRSEATIDSISTLEGKIKFFDMATRKDPRSPYVLQHYARMYLRARHPESALRLIEQALDLDSKLVILHHTKAEILKYLALNSGGGAISRKWLVQSEDSYKSALRIYRKDDYSYYGLADLYFEWGKSYNESDYIVKAETTIDEGLSIVNRRMGLWVLSAKIQEWLGNEPNRIKYLHKAITESPLSTVPRYVLGRAYRKMGQPEKTLEILKPVIEGGTEDAFRCFVEYAKALLQTGASYAEAIAILELTKTFGLRDVRFIATLGGLLFMNQEFTYADAIFTETQKRNFNVEEKYSIEFQPPDKSNPSNNLRLHGTVKDVSVKNSRIETEGFPNFVCKGTKYNGIIMEVGLKLSFEPAFSAVGPIAINPIRISE